MWIPPYLWLCVKSYDTFDTGFEFSVLIDDVMHARMILKEGLMLNMTA